MTVKMQIEPNVPVMLWCCSVRVLPKGSEGWRPHVASWDDLALGGFKIH